MDEINYFIDYAKKFVEYIKICLVTNVSELTDGTSDYSEFSIKNEYLTIIELEEIVHDLNSFGFEVISFHEEMDFIKFVLENQISQDKGFLVYCTAQKGTKIGRKSLIPAFCDLNNIFHANSNPYVVSLCRNKFHSGCILENACFKVPKSWLFNNTNGWFAGIEPKNGTKVIIKLNNEAASIGLDQNNIMIYSESTEEFIKNMSLNFNQEVIVQEFIKGYEIEVPIICSEKVTYPVMAVGISIHKQEFLDDNILTYDIRGNENYDFYNFNSVNYTLANEIMQLACNAAKILGIQGFGRIDFRINSNGEYYITDIATNPHLVKHSSFYYAFSTLGFTHSEMLATLIGISIQRNSYDSDQYAISVNK